MPFTVDQLLLTPERQAQFEAALENLDQGDPLAFCVTEAEKEITLYTSAYAIDDETKRSWIRVLVLYIGYTTAEAGVPEDIKDAHERLIEKLKEIRDGKFPNLPPATTATESAQAGRFGGAAKINARNR